MSAFDQKPDGFPAEFYALPKAATALREAAVKRGWRTGAVYSTDTADHPYVTLHLGSPFTGRYYQLTWHTRPTKGRSYRLFGRLMRPVKGEPWCDAPSLQSILETIKGGRS